MRKIIIGSLLMVMMSLLSIQNVSAETVKRNIGGWSPQKIWTVNFNTELDVSSINDENIYILDSNDNRVEGLNFEVSDNKKEFLIENPKSYKSGEKYRIFITSGIRSNQGVNAEKSYEFTFFIIDRK